MGSEEAILDLVWDLRNLADWLEKHSSEVPDEIVLHAGGQPLVLYPTSDEAMDDVISLLRRGTDQNNVLEVVNDRWVTRSFGKVKVAAFMVPHA